MSGRSSIRLAVGASLAVIVALTALGIYWIAVTPRSALPVGYHLEESAVFSLIQIAFGSVGALLAIRRPRNPIGWLFLATAVISAWLQTSAGYALNAIVERRSEGQFVAWIYNLSAGLLQAPLILALVLFPDGRPSTRSGRILLWLTPANLFAVAFLAFFPGPLLNMPSVQNPYPLPTEGPAVAVITLLSVPWFFVVGALLVRDMLVRVRAASGVLAQQLKWVMWSALLIVSWLGLAGSLAVLTYSGPSGGLVTYLARASFAVVFCTLPVAIGLAIVRYRLYDIDLVIRRTLVYGTLSASIGLIYVALVVFFQAALRPLTSGSEVAVAASTLATLALVQPIRSRVQNAVDHRFFRARYDASRTIDAFTATLMNEVEIDRVRGDLLDVVARSIEPAHASVWLRK